MALSFVPATLVYTSPFESDCVTPCARTDTSPESSPVYGRSGASRPKLPLNSMLTTLIDDVWHTVPFASGENVTSTSAWSP